MNTKEINILFNLVGISVQEVADRSGEQRPVVSQLVNYERINPRARKKVARAVASFIEERLFDEASGSDARSQ